MMRKLTEIIASLFFPIECIHCGQGGSFFCPDCKQSVVPLAASTCRLCNKNQSLTGVCEFCSTDTALDSLIALYQYKGTILEKTIEHLKFQYIESLAQDLAQLVSQELEKNDLLKSLSGGLLIPIPLHKKRYLERGFNQSDLLAKEFSKTLDLPLETKALSRVKKTKQQARLDRAARQDNVDQAFVVNDKIAINGKHIILVDDVATSGATLNAAAEELKKHGASQVTGLVIAHG